ncbi:uncharacterized protein LOC121738240 [Aricia agestis]|uniref:uncharacterized protein LOC121738240 n=1 Tax=Aricia agestis TaxID=91739 RepID=UPI001C2054B3|nr:uncharacterized protein LOC121738240 [Aricia agestis]
MFPSKNLFESNEMNRYFSHSMDNDPVPQYSYFQSPIANRSSSSADSVSPENYIDISFQCSGVTRRSRITPSPNPTISSLNDIWESPLERNLMFTTSPQPFRSSQIYESSRSSQMMYESPQSLRMYESPKSYNRPIVGRKILGAAQDKKEPFIDWTPPSSQPKSYELFPKTEELIPTKSPTLSIPRPPSVNSNYSSTHSNYTSPYNFRVPQSKPQFGAQICTFCRKNGERPAVYQDHVVKKKVGDRYIVSCPILRSHRCQYCGASGDDAHTITYCPVLRSSNNGKPLVSTTVKLKSTPIKSNGKRRYTGSMARM